MKKSRSNRTADCVCALLAAFWGQRHGEVTPTPFSFNEHWMRKGDADIVIVTLLSKSWHLPSGC
jgi:hypothetical protein